MIYMLDCSGVGIANIITILKRILNVVWIVTPILAIIYLAVNFTKLMANPEEKKLPKKIRNQLLALIIVFMVPTIVNAMMYILDDSTDISSCWKNAEVKSNFAETSTYQEPLTNLPRNSISEDRSDYEKGDKRTTPSDSGTSSSTYPAASSTSLANLFAAAKRADNHTYTRGYHYGNAVSWDGTDMKDGNGKNTVSCDRGVALTLYFAGLINTSPHKLGLPALSSELANRGWTKITNYDSLKPGDVVFYNSGSGTTSLGHTFLIGETIDSRYDWGMNQRIKHQGNYSGGMPFREGIARNRFLYAYRMP